VPSEEEWKKLEALPNLEGVMFVHVGLDLYKKLLNSARIEKASQKAALAALSALEKERDEIKSNYERFVRNTDKLFDENAKLREALEKAEKTIDAMFNACAVERAELGDNWTQITRVREIGFAHQRSRTQSEGK
jgi:septal ring factor EnvC (AmiA/AmiB activator)